MATKSKSTKRSLASMLLAFESFIVFFATLAAFGTKAADGRIVWAVGLTLSLLLILTPGILGKEYSYAFGWALQAFVWAFGIWVPLMWFIGLVTTGMWAWAMIAGGTIDKARAVYEREQAALGQTGNSDK